MRAVPGEESRILVWESWGSQASGAGGVRAGEDFQGGLVQERRGVLSRGLAGAKVGSLGNGRVVEGSRAPSSRRRAGCGVCVCLVWSRIVSPTPGSPPAASAWTPRCPPSQSSRGLRKSLSLTCPLSPLCREALLPARRSQGGECPLLLLPCSPSWWVRLPEAVNSVGRFVPGQVVCRALGG